MWPQGIEWVARPIASRRRILDDDDDDDDGCGKQRAIEEQVTEQPYKNPPLIDLANNGGTKPKGKVQRTLSDLM